MVIFVAQMKAYNEVRQRDNMHVQVKHKHKLFININSCRLLGTWIIIIIKHVQYLVYQ